MAFYDICHEKGVPYDFMWSCGMHVCKVCGRKWYSVVPPWPEVGGTYIPAYWKEGWSWARLLKKKTKM